MPTIYEDFGEQRIHTFGDFELDTSTIELTKSGRTGLSPNRPSASTVARAAELVEIEGYINDALAGGRRTMFITGDAGMGKSAHVDMALERIAHSTGVRRCGHSSCRRYSTPTGSKRCDVGLWKPSFLLATSMRRFISCRSPSHPCRDDADLLLRT